MKITIEPSFFNRVYYPYLQDVHRYQIFFGGAGSGKSVFLATRCVLDALQGRNILVARQVARTLRNSCFNEIVKAAERMGLARLFRVSRTDHVITARPNGAQILFAGLDDVEKIKSITPARGALTDVWLEEATECAYRDFKQLDKRLRGQSSHLKRFTLSFNPIDREHWLYREFFGIFPDGGRKAASDRVSILKTTYRDNRFLTPEDGLALERETDPYFYRVYTQGDWGLREGAVFRNWRVEELTDPPGETRYGLDFGFACDPCGLVRVRLDEKHKTVYVLSECREKGLTNAALAQRVLAMAGTAPVICDSAEPKSIAELRLLGVNARPARKGPDSVMHGVQWLQGHTLVVDTRCTGMRAELAGYVWQRDRDGRSLPQPRDRDNHLIDAMRYALENDSQSRRIFTGRKSDLGL